MLRQGCDTTTLGIIPAEPGIQVQCSDSRVPPRRCLDPGFRRVTVWARNLP